MKKASLLIDMTPMVDLGFLLIAFFILTVQLNQPAVVKLTMPKDGGFTKVAASRSMTILIDGDAHLYFYSGEEKEALSTNTIFQTSYAENAIGKIIREKQTVLGPAKDSLFVLIKTSDHSSYRNLVDIMDEMLINNVKRYAFTDLSNPESDYIEKRH